MNVLSRHAHYASMYFSHKKEDSLKELKRDKFYGINFIRFNKALDDVWDRLLKKYDRNQIQYKIISLCGGVLEAINKNRSGLLTAEQSMLCAINVYMKEQQSLTGNIPVE